MSVVLAFSDAGCVTGFGNVMHNLGERLVRDFGHEVHVLAVNHRGDDYPSILDPEQTTSLRLYRPDLVQGGDMYGRSRVVELLGKVEPDVVFMLNDPQIIIQLLFENQYDPKRALLQYRPILSYVPCDGYNLPRPWPNLVPKVTRMVTMSHFGQESYPGSEMVYHGVDTETFRPAGSGPLALSNGEVIRTRREAKKAFGFDPDGFLVLRVDSNSGRKDYPALWKALIPVMKRHSDIQAHFHCEMRKPGHGINFEGLLSREPDIERGRFFFPDLHDSFSGWPISDLVGLHWAADLEVSTSRGEGFGLNLAEGSACGNPLIAQNVSAIPEVVGPGGILIEPQRLITVPSGEDQWLADIDAFTEAIEYLYSSAGARRDLGQAGREHVVSSFNWDECAARFHGYLEELASSGREPEEAQSGP
jgi:glycosyltransferase involved in cell wall biosynthesis